MNTFDLQEQLGTENNGFFSVPHGLPYTVYKAIHKKITFLLGAIRDGELKTGNRGRFFFSESGGTKKR